MPLPVSAGHPTLFILRAAFERSGITRSSLDEGLGLTAEEFRVEGQLIAVGPVMDDQRLSEVIAALEGAGLVYFDDFFELSGNWPEWLRLLAMA